MAESVIRLSDTVMTQNYPVNISLTNGAINLFKNNKVVVVSVGLRPSESVAGGTTICTLPYHPAGIVYATMADATNKTATIFSLEPSGTLKNMVALVAGDWVEGELVFLI